MMVASSPKKTVLWVTLQIAWSSICGDMYAADTALACIDVCVVCLLCCQCTGRVQYQG